MLDVQVVGAGPSGSWAAKKAAELGANVLVSEEHKEIGEPVQCSGVVSKRGLDELGVDWRKVSLNEYKGARLFSHSCKELFVKAKESKAVLLDRAGFDCLLAAEAESSGAKFEFGTRILKPNGAKYTIGADGPNSVIARHYGFPEINDWVLGAQAVYEKASLTEKDVVTAFFSHTKFPGFFGWVIPINEECCKVGVGVRKGSNVKRAFDALCSLPAVSSMITGANQLSFTGGPIPVSPRSRTAVSNAMLVGDAAGQVKATTGGGVFFGASCGAIAGETAANCLETSEYEALWRKAHARDLELHKKVRAVLNSFSDSMIDFYFDVGKRVGLESFLSAYGEMDRPSEMLSRLGPAHPLSLLCKQFNIR